MCIGGYSVHKVAHGVYTGQLTGKLYDKAIGLILQLNKTDA